MTISSVFEPCSLNFSSGYSGTKEILPPVLELKGKRKDWKTTVNYRGDVTEVT